MKKYLLSAAAMLASCAPAQSYAVTTEQCQEIKSASEAVLTMGADQTGNSHEAVYFGGKVIEEMYPAISSRGAMFISIETIHAGGWRWAEKPSEMFDECLQNDPKFNGKYFKGELK